jgi:hypothetical protein
MNERKKERKKILFSNQILTSNEVDFKMANLGLPVILHYRRHSKNSSSLNTITQKESATKALIVACQKFSVFLLLLFLSSSLPFFFSSYLLSITIENH